MKLADDELQIISRLFPTRLGEPEVSVLIQRMLAELKERRVTDLELHRLADVCNGFYERKGYWPTTTTLQLMQTILALAI